MDIIQLRIDPSGIGTCDNWRCPKPDRFNCYVTECLKVDCREVRCELCMPDHLAIHDPGGLGRIPPSAPRPVTEEPTMSLNLNGSAKWIIGALIASTLVLGYQQMRLAVDENDIATLKSDIQEIKLGVKELVTEKRAEARAR